MGIIRPTIAQTLKGFATGGTLSGFHTDFSLCVPRVLTTFEPWAEISERLRRICLRIPSVYLFTNSFGCVFVYKFNLTH
jgi:hypothetical protein